MARVGYTAGYAQRVSSNLSLSTAPLKRCPRRCRLILRQKLPSSGTP